MWEIIHLKIFFAFDSYSKIAEEIYWVYLSIVFNKLEDQNRKITATLLATNILTILQKL